MSFWNLSDSSEKLETTGSFEAGGSIEPIPANTQVKAAPDEAKWDDYEGREYISLRWTILAPTEYKGRKIFQKIKSFMTLAQVCNVICAAVLPGAKLAQ